MVDHKFINPAPDLSDSSLEKWYKSEYQNMCDLYCEGDVFRLSYLKDYSFYLSEYMRALYVLQLHGVSEMPKYSIAPHVAKDILINYGHLKKDSLKNSEDIKISDIISKPLKNSKRQDKYNQVTDWCKTNAGKKVKVKDVAELVDWSYPTANNFVQSRVDLFVKFSHGVYTLRNPDIDRLKDKNAKFEDAKFEDDTQKENGAPKTKGKTNATRKKTAKKV